MSLSEQQAALYSNFPSEKAKWQHLNCAYSASLKISQLFLSLIFIMRKACYLNIYFGTWACLEV